MRESLEAEGIHAEWVAIAAETRCCTTFVEPSGVTTEVIEPSPSVMPAEREEYDRLFNQRIAGAGLLVIAGRAVEGETPDCYRRFLAKARALDIATLLDSSGPAAAAALQAGPDILKVNQRELEELSGTPADTLDGRVRACRSLASRWGIRWFLVSRGADGIEGFDGAVLLHAAAPAVPVRNPIGSGDAATAGAAWAVHEMLRSRAPREILTKRASLERALADAAAMGTANCLNAMNARVIEEDYLRIRQQVRVSRLPIP